MISGPVCNILVRLVEAEEDAEWLAAAPLSLQLMNGFLDTWIGRIAFQPADRIAVTVEIFALW